MNKYKYLLFDLDGTLFDFKLAEKTAIKRVFKKFDVPDDDKTVERYSAINDSYWKRYEKGIIKRSDIFVNRFITLLERLSLDRDAEKIAACYFENLALCGFAFDGAEKLLKSLKGKYVICAATNGVKKTQDNRIKLSGLSEYFDYIFISEEMKTKKPDREFFDIIFNKVGCTDPKTALMIGDSLSGDIAGGINAGCDTCYVNLEKNSAPVPKETTYTVTELEQIIPACGL